MRKWFTAKELEGLPGLPGTARNVKLMADRKNWEGQRRQGTKATEYHLEALPLETQRALLSAAAKETASKTAAERKKSVSIEFSRPVVDTADLGHRQTLIRDARLFVFNMLEALVAQKTPRKTACRQLLELAATQQLKQEALLALAIANRESGLAWAVRLSDGFPVAEPLPGQDLVSAACKTNVRTLCRWLETVDAQGKQALAPGKREADMSVKPWAPYFLAEMQRPQKPHLSDAWGDMCKKLPEDIKAPSYHQVYRWYTHKYSNLDKQRGRHQGSAMNPHKFHLTRTSEGMVPMQELHSDGWGTKFTAPHPQSGKYVKLEVWHTHDVTTRYVFRPSVGFSESTLVILASFRNAVAFGGVPAAWQTDNTSSVKNDKVSFNPVTSLKSRLGFEIVHSLPGNSQANGIAENFNKYLDRRARDLATYMAKPMDSLAQKRVLKVTQKLVKTECSDTKRQLHAEAEKVGSGLLVQSFEEARDLIERWCDEFNHRPHRSLPRITDPETGKRRHQTPAEAMAAHVAKGWRPVAVTGAEINDLFRHHETRTARRGTVTIESQSYYHPELEHWNGEEVQVAYDMDDGERVWVKKLDGSLICEASIVKARGYRTQSFYEMAMEKRADKQIARLEARIAEVDRQRPVLTLEHETTSLLEGLRTVTLDRITTPFTQGELIEAEPVEPVAVEPKKATASTEWTVPTTPDARWPLWVATHAQVEAGIKIDNPPLLKWLDTYQMTSEYRSFAQRSEQR